MLDWVAPGEALEIFAELGVVFLLFWVGLETRLSEMRAMGRVAVAVGSAGVILPFLGGIGLGIALGEGTETSVFLGAALAATSAGITAATFLDLGIARSPAARTVLGAAVVDDILALVLLSVAVGMAADGGVDGGNIALSLALAIAFVAFFALGGTRLLQGRPQLLDAPRFADSPLAGGDPLPRPRRILRPDRPGGADRRLPRRDDRRRDQGPERDRGGEAALRLLPLLLRLHRDRARPQRVDQRARAVAAGDDHRAGGRHQADPGLPGSTGLGQEQARIVGVGMAPRDEVGIVIASIGAAEGVIDPELFDVVVDMSILTTLLAPLALRRLTQAS